MKITRKIKNIDSEYSIEDLTHDEMDLIVKGLGLFKWIDRYNRSVSEDTCDALALQGKIISVGKIETYTFES